MLQAEDFLYPFIFSVWTVNTLEASPAFNASIQVFGHPVHNTNNFVCFSNNAFDNTYVQDSDVRCSFPLHSLDRNSITHLYFFSCFELLGLFFLVPSQHPITIFNKKLILVILSAPGSSNYSDRKSVV